MNRADTILRDWVRSDTHLTPAYDRISVSGNLSARISYLEGLPIRFDGGSDEYARSYWMWEVWIPGINGKFDVRANYTGGANTQEGAAKHADEALRLLDYDLNGQRFEIMM